MSPSPVINKAVPNAREYYPLNEPALGTTVSHEAQAPLLFRPLTLRGTTFKNRIWVSPMCQYSSHDGHATDWHLVHLGAFATRGAGAIITESTAVLSEGRISPEDAGLWKDSQIEPLKRIVDFVHAHDTKIGVQLSHAGRKSSTYALWLQLKLGMEKKSMACKNENGWPDEVYGPSSVPFSRGTYPDPKEVTEDYINKFTNAFVDATRRADKAGYDFVEVHTAHGYLLHSFLSPLSNVRTDIYGGQELENRLRVPLNVVKKVREAWSGHKPLFVRISGTDWAEGPEKDANGKWLQWGIEQNIIFARKLEELGVDLIDVSSGGNWVAQKIPVCPGYQVPFAAELKKALPKMRVASVGAITEPEQAEAYLQQKSTDVVLLAREMLRNPAWPFYAAQKLGASLKPANQYELAWPAPIPSSTPPQKVAAKLGRTAQECRTMSTREKDYGVLSVKHKFSLPVFLLLCISAIAFATIIA